MPTVKKETSTVFPEFKISKIPCWISETLCVILGSHSDGYEAYLLGYNSV
jgi:hypothetical protein